MKLTILVAITVPSSMMWLYISYSWSIKENFESKKRLAQLFNSLRANEQSPMWYLMKTVGLPCFFLGSSLAYLLPQVLIWIF